jgi:hypothetical protein
MPHNVTLLQILKLMRTNVRSSRVKNTQDRETERERGGERGKEREAERERPIRVMLHVMMQGTG